MGRVNGRSREGKGKGKVRAEWTEEERTRVDLSVFVTFKDVVNELLDRSSLGGGNQSE